MTNKMKRNDCSNDLMRCGIDMLMEALVMFAYEINHADNPMEVIQYVYEQVAQDKSL